MTNYELRMTIDNLLNSSIVNRQSSIAPPPFHTFNAQHLITLGVIIALCGLSAWAAVVWTPPARKWLGRLIGLILLCYAVVFYAQQGIGNNLSWQYSLPLELCNLILIACIISLFWPNQFTAEIAYFWGLGGVLQAMATPDLGLGFPSWDFILFFWGHGAALLAIVFLIANKSFRPRRGSVARMMVALNLYGLAVGIIDAVAGWNYGYLCRKPAAPSLLDLLGPWPWYLLSLEAIAFLSFFLLDLPWRLLILFRKRQRGLTIND
jgi:hypothetical integral membrane protein (TIGR02206 family)